MSLKWKQVWVSTVKEYEGVSIVFEDGRKEIKVFTDEQLLARGNIQQPQRVVETSDGLEPHLCVGLCELCLGGCRFRHIPSQCTP